MFSVGKVGMDEEGGDPAGSLAFNPIQLLPMAASDASIAVSILSFMMVLTFLVFPGFVLAPEFRIQFGLEACTVRSPNLSRIGALGKSHQNSFAPVDFLRIPRTPVAWADTGSHLRQRPPAGTWRRRLPAQTTRREWQAHKLCGCSRQYRARSRCSAARCRLLRVRSP